MANLADFTAANSAFVAAFTDGDKPMPPARKALVITCMDGGLTPEWQGRHAAH
jgi:carbonic anhydrase